MAKYMFVSIFCVKKTGRIWGDAENVYICKRKPLRVEIIFI